VLPLTNPTRLKKRRATPSLEIALGRRFEPGLEQYVALVTQWSEWGSYERCLIFALISGFHYLVESRDYIENVVLVALLTFLQLERWSSIFLIVFLFV
jgi:hypothetical protein